MPPRLRKLVLTAHIIASVGWLGAVVAFLALAIVGVASEDPPVVQGMYLAMEVMGRYALVPLSLAALLTGLIQGVGTPWGLFRHYWVVFKLLITVFAVLVLLLYLETLRAFADLATGMRATSTDLHAMQTPSPVLHAGAALVLMLVATILSVYKPRGVTPYGRRQRRRS